MPILGLVISVAVFVSVILVVRSLWTAATITSVHSSVCSMQRVLASVDVTIGLRPSHNWRTLSNYERHEVLKRAHAEMLVGIDLGRSTLNGDGTVIDPWGAPYELAIRNSYNDQPEVDVWSVGPDGVSGTKDDIRCRGTAKLGIEGAEPAFRVPRDLLGSGSKEDGGVEAESVD